MRTTHIRVHYCAESMSTASIGDGLWRMILVWRRHETTRPQRLFRGRASDGSQPDDDGKPDGNQLEAEPKSGVDYVSSLVTTLSLHGSCTHMWALDVNLPTTRSSASVQTMIVEYAGRSITHR